MRSFVLAFVFLALALPAVAAPSNGTADVLEAMVNSLQRDGALDLDGEPVVATRAVALFYRTNGYSLAWSRPAVVKRLVAALGDLRDDGLDPADYHGHALSTLGSSPLSEPRALARRDVLLTDALYCALYHLTFGKADPTQLDQDWNLDELYAGLDLADAQTRDAATAQVLAAVAAGDPAGLIRRARPDHRFYRELQAAYVRYRALAEAGGWPTVPAGPTLHEGDRDPRVRPLRRRLAATGDLSAAGDDRTDFDADLAAAVVLFQRRHGLDADGRVGRETLAALNVPAAERAATIRVNLERARWVMAQDVDPDLLVVNIAAFEVWLVRADQVVWRARCQVGTPYTRTPVFADAMTYLEFNPSWTVPESIANRTILPLVKQDPGYLAAQGMVLLDGSGREVSPAAIDWVEADRVPHLLRQKPGPQNALGRVKFMFPNKHSVYLHDTPSRSNFNRSTRAFSSGCIRVENPLELAALLLGDQPAWTRQHIDAVIAGGERTVVRLAEPLPVFLLYWTAFVEDDGSVQFREDLYARDASILAALGGPLKLHRRHAAANQAN